MLNVNKLKGKMVEKGFTIEKLSNSLGINPSTFYRKLKNNSFEIGEADEIVEALGLSAFDATEIFFAQTVA